MWATKEEIIRAIEEENGDQYCPECRRPAELYENAYYCSNPMCLNEEREYTPDHPLFMEPEIFSLPEDEE